RAGSKIRFPFYREVNGRIQAVSAVNKTETVVEVDVLITSGMLVKVSVWEQGVRYDPSLFVDYTDTEWCFRARASGYHIFADLEQEMGHAPSDEPPARIFGLNFFIYSPLRRYYYFRNS